MLINNGHNGYNIHFVIIDTMLNNNGIKNTTSKQGFICCLLYLIGQLSGFLLPSYHHKVLSYSFNSSEAHSCH